MRSLSSLALTVLVALGAPACSAPGGAPEDVGAAVEAVTAQEAIMRAEEWATAKLLYCQSPNGADDSIDPACSPICMRQSNPQWDPYRSDCSGLVSWAWGLPPPGRTTAEFAPNESDITSVIMASALQMGDAVNTDDSLSSEHHIMLFKAWTVPGQTATFVEEPGCSATPNYAHELTSDVTLNGSRIKVAYNGITFTAIRYGALGSSTSASSGLPPPTCQVDGVDGTCIDTSVCATMPGYHSTPGYCPGPASEQCCTPMGGASTSSSSSSSGAGTGGAAGAGGAPDTGTSGGGAHGTTGGTNGAQGGCQTSLAAESPAASGLGLLAGLLLLRRRKRST